MKDWSDFKLKHFRKLHDCTNFFTQLSVVSEIEENELRNMSLSVVAKLKERFNWFFTGKIPVEHKFYLTIDGKEYFNDLTELTAGQYADIQVKTINPASYKLYAKLEKAENKEEIETQIIKLNEKWTLQHANEIIAILLKPTNVKYSDYNWKEIASKIDDCQISQVLGIIGFFLTIQKPSNFNFPAFLEEVKAMVLKKQREKSGLRYLLSLPKTQYLMWRLSQISI